MWFKMLICLFLMPSYVETVKVFFGGLVRINILIEEIQVRFKAGPNPEALVVKELWLKPRQWAKGKHLPRTFVTASPEWELLIEQSPTKLKDVVALGVGLGTGLLICWGWWTAQQFPSIPTSSYKEEVFLSCGIFLVPFFKILFFLFSFISIDSIIWTKATQLSGKSFFFSSNRSFIFA